MFSVGGMRNSFLCSAISSDSFPFFLLSLTAKTLEKGGYFHCHHFITVHSHSFIPFEIRLPPPPFNWNHSLLNTINDLLLPNPNLASALDHPGPLRSMTPPPPTPSSVSAPQFQPQTAHFTESARPGFGHSPKLSFLIYEMGLIKPIIYVWHTHGQPPNCSPYLAPISHMHRCQINLSKLHNDHVISLFRKLQLPPGTGKLQVCLLAHEVSTVSSNRAPLCCNQSRNPAGLRIWRLFRGVSLASD